MSNNLSDKLKEKAAETALLVGAAAILGLVCAGPAGHLEEPPDFGMISA